ncbi:MAG: YraN family protein [Emcibacteraceae bacterium]
MVKPAKKKAYKWGQLAELFASLMLRFKGYSIVARRYKTRVGEIDIIARKGPLTIFCEVKARDDYSKASIFPFTKTDQPYQQGSRILYGTLEK